MRSVKKVIVLLMAMLCLCSCELQMGNNQTDISLSEDIYISLSSPYSRTYYFSITKNKQYTVAKGKGCVSLEEWREGKAEIIESREIVLNDKEFRDIAKIYNELGELGELNYCVTDWWMVDIYYNNENLYYIYGCAENKKYDLLVEKLIELSPMEMTDNFGLAIKPYEDSGWLFW